MSYAREHQEEHPMQRFADSLRDYFEDMRRIRQSSRGGERSRSAYDRHAYDSMAYDRPSQRTMGFNSQRSQEREEEEYGRYERRENSGGDYKEFLRHMMRYWKSVCSDLKQGNADEHPELMKAMAMVAAEAVRYFMEEKGERGGKKHGHEGEGKKRLEKAVNKIRRAPLQDRNKLMREMFPDIKGHAQKVLQDLLAQEGVEQRARKLNMSEEEYCEAKEELARVLNESEEEED